MKLTIKPKPIHLAKMIRSDGEVSPLCAEKPRKIDLGKSSWTIRKEAVTCERCLARIRELTPVTQLSAMSEV